MKYRILLALIGISAVSLLSAQGRVNGRTIDIRPSDSAELLALPAVLKEIHKSEDILPKIAQRQQATSARFKKRVKGRKPTEKDQSWYASELRKDDDALFKLLTPDQRKRLREIYLQSMGPQALQAPSVVKELRITPKQRSAIAIAFRDIYSPADSVRQSSNTKTDSEDAWLLNIRERSKRLAAKIPDLLTPSQQTKWKTILGSPFDLALISPSAIRKDAEERIRQWEQQHDKG